MEIGKLDHVNIRTTQLETMIDWYTNILGMHSGHRPDFPFPGAWMYAGDVAAVHLVGIDDVDLRVLRGHRLLCRLHRLGLIKIPGSLLQEA